MELLTPRLRLRPWADADREPFAAMSADPAMMAHLLPFASRADSDAWIDRQIAHDRQHGFCLWAAAERDTGTLLGAIGLLRPRFEAPFTPAVEVGWRLAPACWGRGLAPEGAVHALQHGFDALGLAEIVAYTSPGNANSRRVMAKLGMTRDPGDDFDHPLTPVGHPLRRCVLYRLPRAGWAGVPPGPAR